MTAKVIEALESIKDLQIFEDSPLAFIGGTALAYTLGHRISEDIDIICNKPLAYQKIITSVQSIGGKKYEMKTVLPYEWLVYFQMSICSNLIYMA